MPKLLFLDTQPLVSSQFGARASYMYDFDLREFLGLVQCLGQSQILIRIWPDPNWDLATAVPGTGQIPIGV